MDVFLVDGEKRSVLLVSYHRASNALILGDGSPHPTLMLSIDKRDYVMDHGQTIEDVKRRKLVTVFVCLNFSFRYRLSVLFVSRLGFSSNRRKLCSSDV